MDPGTILLVDDDPEIREFLGLYLETSGHAVTVATDGSEALEELERSVPDLIIADVKMPRMTGYDLCRRVRESGREEIPFIFCSALGGLPERMKGLRMGADDYVVKPVNPEELLLKVETALGRRRRMRRLEDEFFRRSSLLLLEGRLGELSVVDALQVSSILRRDDVRLELIDGGGRSGSVYLRGDRLLHAEVEDASGLPAFHQVLAWTGGVFRLEQADFAGDPTIDRSLDGCLLEGVARLDQYQRVRDLVGAGDRLRVRPAADGPARRFDDPTEEVLSLVSRFGALDRVVEESPLSELQTLRILSELLASGVIESFSRNGGQDGTHTDRA